MAEAEAVADTLAPAPAESVQEVYEEEPEMPEYGELPEMPEQQTEKAKTKTTKVKLGESTIDETSKPISTENSEEAGA